MFSEFKLKTLHHKVGCTNLNELLPSTKQCISFKFRTINGTCNNILRPRFGSASNPFRRLVPVKYHDVHGINDPIGFPNQPSAPQLPLALEVAEKFIIPQLRQPITRNLISHAVMQWGQFLDHDITFTAESEDGEKCLEKKGSVKTQDLIICVTFFFNRSKVISILNLIAS